MDRENAVQARDLEDLRDVLVGAHEGQRAARGTQALDASHQHSERRRVDEGRLREVDHDLLLSGLDQLDHPLLELGRRVEVDLSAELDHVGGVVDRLVFDVEVHASPWSRPSVHMPVCEPEEYGSGEITAPVSASAATQGVGACSVGGGALNASACCLTCLRSFFGARSTAFCAARSAVRSSPAAAESCTSARYDS